MASTAALSTSVLASSHGVVVTLPVVTEGDAVVQQVLGVRVAEAGDTAARPVTIASTNPALPLGPARTILQPDADESHVTAKLCVQWYRGEAQFYAEMDLGCSMVVLATRVEVSLATYYNPAISETLLISNPNAPRRATNVSVTPGAHPRPGAGAGPVWTSGPLDIGVFGGALAVRVPPFARALRVASRNRAIVQVCDWAREGESGPSSWLLLQSAILVRSFSEVHPIPGDAGVLHFLSASRFMGDADRLIVKFLLDL